jgi:hypothetical protein
MQAVAREATYRIKVPRNGAGTPEKPNVTVGGIKTEALIQGSAIAALNGGVKTVASVGHARESQRNQREAEQCRARTEVLSGRILRYLQEVFYERCHLA